MIAKSRERVVGLEGGRLEKVLSTELVTTPPDSPPLKIMRVHYRSMRPLQLFVLKQLILPPC